MRRKISVAIPILLLFVIACHKNYPPELIPAATKLDVAQKVNRLMDTAIEMEAQKVISTPTARVIVKFCVAADQTIQDGPADWKAVIKSAWENLKKNELIQPYLTTVWAIAAFNAVDTLIGGL